MSNKLIYEDDEPCSYGNNLTNETDQEDGNESDGDKFTEEESEYSNDESLPNVITIDDLENAKNLLLFREENDNLARHSKLEDTSNELTSVDSQNEITEEPPTNEVKSIIYIFYFLKIIK